MGLFILAVTVKVLFLEVSSIAVTSKERNRIQ